MSYAEIVDNKIVQIRESLPQSYRNISNFFALNLEQLADLTWSGNPDVRFYECVSDLSEVLPPNSVRSGVTYAIDHENKKVLVTYEIQEIAQPVPTVPETISARQIRLWLIQNGHSLAAVAAAIDSIPEQTQRDMTRVEWEYAPYVERAHPMLIPLAAALGLTEQQVDQAFQEAVNI